MYKLVTVHSGDDFDRNLCYQGRLNHPLVPYELTSCAVSKKEVTQRFTEDAQRFTENSLKLCVSPCFLCASLCSFFLVLARPD